MRALDQLAARLGGRPVFGPADLEKIADGTQYLMLGVYDGESYLVWKRANS
jgi:hypothetical protein